jgi:nucleotide-binding universal stress UspA family protein
MTTEAAPFHRLLLATEHSEFDVGAERIAFALARRLRAPLAVVMPMFGNAEFDASAPELAARADADAAAKVQDLRALAQAQGLSLEVQVRRGPEPYREIVDEARAQGSGVIVIRRRGRSGFLANLLVGEMVSKVVAHAPCDVLVNARDAQFWTRRVLAALDPLAPSPAMLAHAARAAVQFDLPLTLVAVIDANGRGLRAQADAACAAGLAQVRALGARADAEVRVGKAHEQILDAARHADLVVLGRHGATRLSRAFIGGVAQKVIGLAEASVLVCMPAAEGSDEGSSP